MLDACKGKCLELPVRGKKISKLLNMLKKRENLNILQFSIEQCWWVWQKGHRKIGMLIISSNILSLLGRKKTWERFLVLLRRLGIFLHWCCGREWSVRVLTWGHGTSQKLFRSSQKRRKMMHLLTGSSDPKSGSRFTANELMGKHCCVARCWRAHSRSEAAQWTPGGENEEEGPSG